MSFGDFFLYYKTQNETKLKKNYKTNTVICIVYMEKYNFCIARALPDSNGIVQE